MGTPIREILEEHAGGMRDGVRFAACCPAAPRPTSSWTITSTCRWTSSRVAEGRQPSRHRHDDRARRSDLPGGHGAEPRSTSSRRNRAAGARRAGAGLHWVAEFCEAMEEGAGQPGDLERLSSAHAAARARTHILRAGARRGRAAAERAEILPRRFRAAHPRTPLSVALTWRRSTSIDRPHRRARRREPAARLPLARTSTCPTSAGTRRWDRSAPAGNAPSSSSRTRTTRTASL